MEVGDVYVVNKGDLGGADLMVVSLLSLVRTLKSRSPPVIKVSALSGDGMKELGAVIDNLRSKFSGGSREMRLKATKGMMLEMAKGDLMESFTMSSSSMVEELSREVLVGKTTVAEAAKRLTRIGPVSSSSAHTRGSSVRRRSDRA